MPSEVMHHDTARKVRRNTEYQMPSLSSSGNSGSLAFLKKLWKDKKICSDSDDASSDCSSPKLFRRVNATNTKRNSHNHHPQQPSNLLTVNNNEISRSRSPSPLMFRKKLSRRSSTSNEKSNENLLHYFVSHQDYSSLDKLLANTHEPVDLDTMRPPGISALHVACVLGDLKIVKLLVSKGADVRLKSMMGLSPLKVAALSGSYEIAQYLVSSGANDDDIKDGFQIDSKNKSYAKRTKSL